MLRKMVPITVIVIALCMALNVQADDKWIGGVDDNWNNGANWEDGSAPTAVDKANVSPSYVPGTSYDPVVYSGNTADTANLQYKDWFDAMPAGTPFSMTIKNGASLISAGSYNMWGAWFMHATMYVEDGAYINLNNANGGLYLGSGGHESVGTVHMAGGELIAGSIHMGMTTDYGDLSAPEALGQFYQSGGVVDLKWELKAYTPFDPAFPADANPNHVYDLTGGELRIGGNMVARMNDYETWGILINSVGGALDIQYDAGINKTIVTPIPEPTSMILLAIGSVGCMLRRRK